MLTSNDHYTNLLVFIIASSTIFQSFNIIDFYCQATVQSKYIAFANAITLSISSVIKVALILNEAPLIAFAFMVVIDSFVLACGFIYFYLKHLKLKLLDFKFNRTIAVELLRDSWPLIFSGLVISVYVKIDQVMIKEMMNVEAVGQYAAAVRISEGWYFIPMVIASSILPALINAKKQCEQLYYSRLQKLFDFIVWMSIAIAVIMTFLSDWLIIFLYGEQYSQAGRVLMIHIWAGVAVSFGIVWSSWILIENKQKMIVYFHVLSMILNVVYNFFFIPSQGIEGAAIATAFASVSAQFIGILYYEKKVALRFLGKVLVPLHYLKGYEK
jgi:O-antigen/teichoic acid export membrane protein